MALMKIVLIINSAVRECNLTDTMTDITYLQRILVYLVVLIGGYRDKGCFMEDMCTVGGIF